MEEKQHLIQVPDNYPVCLNSQCSKATTCLRQLAGQAVAADVKFLFVINPKHQATLGQDCPYFRPDTKVYYAKGFIKILDHLPVCEMKKVVSSLISHFGQRTYYRIRKGERLLSPSEQRVILNIFKRCGVTGTPEFDAYVEDYEW